VRVGFLSLVRIGTGETPGVSIRAETWVDSSFLRGLGMTTDLNQPTRSRGAAAFRSILCSQSEIDADAGNREAPEFFTDLNLDQVVASITAGREEYDLMPFFYAPLSSVDAINYRHEVMRDLENHTLFGHIQSFAQQMRTMRVHLAQADKLYYRYQKERWFLNAVDLYSAAVNRLADDLTHAQLRSRGFSAFRDYLAHYVDSDYFAALVAETQKLKADLSGIRYSLHLQDNRIEVDRYGSESDYGADVLQTFEKFKDGTTQEHRFRFSSGPEMNHVEAAILDLVAQLFPEIFASLDEYFIRHSGYLDRTIARFDREVQFYIACLEHIERFKRFGLSFSYPGVSGQSKEVLGRDVFDLALADKLVRENTPVVTNDFYLKDPERVLIVSGPNQGGKTTFARTFGQLHYLASIGCPVPGKEASLFLFDGMFTHFEKEENIQNLRGKLEDDLLRIHRILERATPNSIVIMNESFLSTTASDALFLSKQVLHRIFERDMLCVSVTFLEELGSLSETTVSMVSTVNAKDPAIRTFKILRKAADGLAYAVAIAEKYRLDYENLKKRIAENIKGRVAS
jgi:DNA mismatch repair protein MutS